MAKQTIAVGTSEQIFDGDRRTLAMKKINDNFTELYAFASANNLFFINPASDPYNADVGIRAASTRFQGYDGSEQFRIETVTNAVSYLIARGGGAGGMPVIVAAGAATDIPLSFAAKGSGGLFFGNGWGTSLMLDDPGSAVVLANYIKILGNVAGSAPTISPDGSDANLDLVLSGKGTGLVRYGSYTGTPGTITGYITIKDSGGTSRKIAVTT